MCDNCGNHNEDREKRYADIEDDICDGCCGCDCEEGLDQEFEQEPEEVYVPTLREKAIRLLTRITQSRTVWYLAGAIDGMILLVILTWLLS